MTHRPTGRGVRRVHIPLRLMLKLNRVARLRALRRRTPQRRIRRPPPV